MEIGISKSFGASEKLVSYRFSVAHGVQRGLLGVRELERFKLDTWHRRVFRGDPIPILIIT